MVDWLIVLCLTPFWTVYQWYRGGQGTHPCSLGALLTSSPRIILSRPLAAFPHNHCRNNGQRWERNQSCRNDYHQSSERILGEPGIEPVTSCYQVRNITDWAIGLGQYVVTWWRVLFAWNLPDSVHQDLVARYVQFHPFLHFFANASPVAHER